MDDRKSRGTRVVAVGGFSSNCGKTTVVCRLLEALGGWEAIKVTKGHYRSCGKDPHACCVSHLLEDAPVIRSGRDATYEHGKDTGRYWDAGASNVHWVIATKAAAADGTAAAIERVDVDAKGVVIEATGAIGSIEADVAVLCATAGQQEIKASTVTALPFADAIFVSGHRRCHDASAIGERLLALARTRRYEGDLPVLIFEDEFELLLDRIGAPAR